jgi:hypothetical protein
MRHSKSKRRSGKTQGVNSEITRRDFLGFTLLASGEVLFDGLSPAQLLAAGDDFKGYRGVGECDAAYNPLADDVIDTSEIFDCVIVGGVSGPGSLLLTA